MQSERSSSKRHSRAWPSPIERTFELRRVVSARRVLGRALSCFGLGVLAQHFLDQRLLSGIQHLQRLGADNRCCAWQCADRLRWRSRS